MRQSETKPLNVQIGHHNCELLSWSQRTTPPSLVALQPLRSCRLTTYATRDSRPNRPHGTYISFCAKQNQSKHTEEPRVRHMVGLFQDLNLAASNRRLHRLHSDTDSLLCWHNQSNRYHVAEHTSEESRPCNECGPFISDGAPPVPVPLLVLRSSRRRRRRVWPPRLLLRLRSIRERLTRRPWGRHHNTGWRRMHHNTKTIWSMLLLISLRRRQRRKRMLRRCRITKSSGAGADGLAGAAAAAATGCSGSIPIKGVAVGILQIGNRVQ